MAERDGTGGIADRPLTVAVSEPRPLCDDGFRPYQRYMLRLPLPDGAALDGSRGGRIFNALTVSALQGCPPTIA